MSTVTAFDPDVVIRGADAPQLDCRDPLSESRARSHSPYPRGEARSGSVSRAQSRAGSGVDDVLSLPFGSRELLSRVRSQLRNKQLADQLRAAEGNRSATEQVVADFADGRPMSATTSASSNLSTTAAGREAERVIATWAGYKKAGSVLTSTEHRHRRWPSQAHANADGQ
jgi:DNA-binding response OmpR family regulator